jgi:Zn-dependent protease
VNVEAAACTDCGAQLAPGLLSCPGCNRLMHREKLVELTQRAAAEERAGELSAALGTLRQTLELLPAGTLQRGAILTRMEQLSATIDGRAPAAAADKRVGTGKLAGLSVLGLFLLKFKSALALLAANAKLLLIGLTKLPTLLSMLLYVRWADTSSAGLALGLVASIYVHEVGHVAALRRYGIAASAPMFIPGFGALVRLKQYPTHVHEDARTGLAGPLWGLGAALLALLLSYMLHSPTARTVASLGALLNLFNLVPVWQLDGARGLRALSKNQRLSVAAVALLAGALVHHWMPALVGAVTLVRAFGNDAYQAGDRGVHATFLALVCAHAALFLLAQ